MFHETRVINPKKCFRLLRCVIYTTIDKYFSIGCLACQSEKLSQISVDFKYVEKYFNRIFDIGIPYLLISFLLYRGFLKNVKSIVILKCLKRMLEYYFSKGFGILECNLNNFAKIPNKVKQIIHSEENTYLILCYYLYQHNSLHMKHTKEVAVT